MSVTATPAAASGDVPVVDSFAVAAQLRMTATGTAACLVLALPEEAKVTPAAVVPALLTLGHRVLEDYRLTDQVLPEVEVTAVERAVTVPTSARATGFTVGVSNDVEARHSSIVLDSDLLLGNDGGLLLAAATLLAGAEHLLEVDDHLTRQRAPARRRAHRRRRPHGQGHFPASL